MLLYEKYTPKSLKELIGNRLSIEKLKEFAADVQAGRKPKPIMAYGPSGTGKTAAMRALAQENSFEILELTSSDYRDAETLKKKLLPAAKTRGLFSKTTLILFDEIDELSSKFDKGAESVINQMLRESRQPIAFTASDFWDQRISFLRNHVDRAEFKKVESRELIDYMKRIAKSEGEEVEEGALREIAYRSDGDVRAALNDLQMVLLGGNDILDNLVVRNRRLEIFRTLDKIFMTNSFLAARGAVDSSDVDTGMLLNWVDENIPNRYWVKQSLDQAYEHLSFASRFFEMAERTRYYGYMKYTNVGIAGVSVSSGGNTKYVSPYAFPSRVKYLSATKEMRGMQSRIAVKLSPYLHTNRHEIISSYLPLFRMLFGKMNQEGKDAAAESLKNDFKLEKEEAGYLFNAA
ncbi:MAG: replication factor C large subunit [Candidatus Micrarchaeota archaeon]|nr:replication factor C large subunit [Candidatus Micrarchaeota archaeon]